ncbi:mediator of RNA polymerase II transcription subunit 27-like isoform X2 [Juglans microcarpa x Juglans regia]|uniref:mediator of RNA polymerase II transcription subunit 27-like isoform X2 n=1 Tax=Juglans microcarpa x Juglans regia TaxID=2249226 RepID=UPI001B7DAA9E|nr:mediator of RNA polymerase II transcription subunit 27-like isoform X2 [Juglans microcarpa x Juglans regia]
MPLASLPTSGWAPTVSSKPPLSPPSLTQAPNLCSCSSKKMPPCVNTSKSSDPLPLLVGRQLEESGVLDESLRSQSDSWGLHMPLVCPDGAVVAYAWKRQLAGQAGASAVDRTRLALKAFTDQKRRFFPHLDDGLDGQSTESASKKRCGHQVQMENHQEELSDYKTLSDVLTHLEKEVPNFRVFTYERLDWLKRASSLPSSANETSMETSNEHNFRSSNKLRLGSLSAVATEKTAVIELLFPSIFRVIVSLHPVGSIDLDSVAFFSPDEGGSYIHARGISVYHVFRLITEHAAMALQYFLGIQAETTLHSLLKWICSYQTLFT